MTRIPLTILSALATSAIAQPIITFTPIAGPDTPVHVVGNRPSLHNGTVAFYGYLNDIYGHDPVIATALADGNQLAFDIRHSVNIASLYVVTIDQTPQACPADLNGDGNLDFFDISVFLNTMPDFNNDNDNDFNFFDVSAFLASFTSGCP
jgi:hypothetical protein